MARIEIDPNYSAPTFPRATASTDLFKKEDVQALAAAMSTHDHTAGKGVALVAGSITSAMIADGTIVAGDLADGAVTSAKILDGAVTSAKIFDGTIATADIAAHAVSQVGWVLSASAESTTAVGVVQIPSSVIVMTLTGGDLLILMTLNCKNTSAAESNYLHLFVDGVDTGLHLSSMTGATVRAPMTAAWYSAPLAPGDHAFAMGWQTSGGTLSTTVDTARYMAVMELRR